MLQIFYRYIHQSFFQGVLQSDFYFLKMRHNKTYTGREEELRRSDWEDNLLRIYEHNMKAAAGHHDYTLRDNHIADLSLDEYIRTLVRSIEKPYPMTFPWFFI